jgi:predicted methyltransferase
MARSFIAAAFAAALMTSTAVLAASAVPAPIAAAVADASRPAADKERDVNRKPAETVAFAGVKPGMTVAELGPGGGYYTRILAKAVGPKGKVFALVTAAQAGRPGALDALNAIVKDNPNVQIVTIDYGNLKLPEKVDLAWTTENYHDFHNGPTANVPALDKGVFDNLKPGGIFYVEDHAAAKGAGAEATSKLHRMDEDIAKQELTAAGFKIAGEGDILKSASDDKTTKNSETGHFNTERFMLKAQKP